VITIAPLARDKLVGVIGLPAVGVLITVLALVDSEADQRVGIAIEVILVDIVLGCVCYRLIRGWKNHLSFEHDVDHLIIRNYSSRDERIPFKDVVSIDARGRQEVIRYRSPGGKTRKYRFVPLATPEVRAWHRFLKSNERHFGALTTPASRQMHAAMDEQLASGETVD
jgi:hypothetical protein